MFMKLNRILLIAALVPLTLPAQELKDAKKETPEEQRIREYILNNPEIVARALELYQLKAKVLESQQAQAALMTQSAALFHDPKTPAAGAGEGGITIVEFFDYRCGYCKRVSPTVAKLLEANPKVRIVYKDFPVLGPESELAAKAALAAHMQGAYLKLHQALLEYNGPINSESIAVLASAGGLDAAKLKADMESAEVRAALEANQKLAAAIGVNATPAFVAGTELIPGALDQAALEGLIDRASAKPAAVAPAGGQ